MTRLARGSQGLRGGRLPRPLERALELPEAWLASRRAARRLAPRLAEVERFCLFVGYPRSGHSLLGSLLDAHPEIVIAHELNVLRYLKYGFRREQLFALLWENARSHAEAGRVQSGYGYAVPGQWQGRVRRLRVIGDKRGGSAIRRLEADPAQLPRLEARVGVPLRFVHVLRNPFDNIATIQRRRPRMDVEAAAAHYFAMVRGVEALWQRLPAQARLDVRHEDLVAEPERELASACRFLGVEDAEDYLRACAGVVWRTPRQSRYEIAWPGGSRARIQTEIERHPFLQGYRFES